VSTHYDGEAPVTGATDDPREQVEVGVLLPNGRLAALHFASRAEADAWAKPEDGEQVVEYNILSECSFNSC
jgi:hypothetical protein